jgi:quercetin dioxygenase-like cupin family protein
MATHRLFLASIVAAVLVAALVVPALGSPSSNILSAPILARGDFTDRVDLQLKFRSDHGMEVVKVRGAGEVVMQRIEIGPGGTTGWHSHPGPVVVVVESGALAFVTEHRGACDEVIYQAGDSFVDQGQGHVHMAYNPSASANTVLFATYFDVGAAGIRIDQPDPGTC